MCTQTAAHPEGRCDAALGEDAWWQDGLVATPELHGDECDEEHESNGESRHNTAIVPCVDGAAPLECQTQRHDTWHKSRDAEGIDFANLLRDRQGCCCGVRNVEQEDDDNQCRKANRKVDKEAPSPRYIRRKSTSDQGTHDRGDAKNSTEKPLKGRSLVQWKRVGDDGKLQEAIVRM